MKFLLGVFIAFNRAVDELLGLSNGAEFTYGPFLDSLILHLPPESFRKKFDGNPPKLGLEVENFVC